MKKYHCFVAALLWFLSSFPCTSAQSQLLRREFSKNMSYEISRWEVVDIVFRSTLQKGINPFDVVFGADFLADGNDGKAIRINGFYNGNNEWILRFSSAGPGQWSFRTFSSLPALTGQGGKIKVSSTSSVVKHGAVQIDPANTQYFVYEDGTPHFLLAFELDWLFALDYKNKELPKTRQLLSAVKDNGFNHVVMNVYAYDVGWKIADNVPKEYYYGKPEYSVFGGTNEKPDFNTLNVGLFQHLDRVIALMQSMGLDAHLMIYVWNKKVNWPPMYSPADNRYFDYVISRYQAFNNVIWDVSKEALDYGRCDIPYINERISRIRAGDAYKRLLTVHDYEYNSREGHRVDFISIQSWRSALYSIMSQARQIHVDKPVVNIEHGGYEKGPYLSFFGNYTSPETCLQRTYECVFAGTYGSYYWQNTSWNIVIHDPFDKKHNFDPPRFDYYKHLAGLFERYSFNSLNPVVAKLTTNSREGMNNVATSGLALSNQKDLYVMMIPSEIEFTNLVIPKPESGKFRATWFNPFSGEYKNEGAAQWTGWNEFINPWKNQMSILIIEGNKE